MSHLFPIKIRSSFMWTEFICLVLQMFVISTSWIRCKHNIYVKFWPQIPQTTPQQTEWTTMNLWKAITVCHGNRLGSADKDINVCINQAGPQVLYLKTLKRDRTFGVGLYLPGSGARISSRYFRWSNEAIRDTQSSSKSLGIGVSHPVHL